MGFPHGTHDRMAGLSYLKQVLMRELEDMSAVQWEDAWICSERNCIGISHIFVFGVPCDSDSNTIALSVVVVV